MVVTGLLGHDEFVLGYGSLLSHDSRWRYSGLNTSVIPVVLSGWVRSWITRNIEEQQSHVGALPSVGGTLNGALVPTETITPALRLREKDYAFTPVSLSDLSLQVPAQQSARLVTELESKTIWICQSLDIHPATSRFPLMQTYLDTCLVGCLENGGEDFARLFIRTTQGWNNGWINDRQAPRYPRAARVETVLLDKVDQLLTECEVIHLRQPHKEQ